MRLSLCLFVLAGCGGEPFSSNSEGPGGGDTGGRDGGGAASASSSDAASSTSGPASGPASSASSGGTGASGGADVGGAGGGSSSASSGEGGTTPCVPKTCESEDVACGKLPDGCGNLLDCGDYLVHDNCSFGAPVYTCECDAAHPVAWQCESGDKKAASPPPAPSGCIGNTGEPDYFWCCELGS